uniref:Uncharacterized protein n=1 Tax=Timema douglasi TaxID=61478 RepID=A0A7R8VRJ7_TIMDO|nr:unnamed protein product [Timema douglasi]
MIDEALKERVQSSLSQHTQACSLDVPREPRRCGNNEFYFVSPQLSSASVPQGYSGIREEDDDSWNGPLETGHSHHSDEDGVHGIREEDDDSWNGPLETGHSQHSDEDGTHSEMRGVGLHGLAQNFGCSVETFKRMSGSKFSLLRSAVLRNMCFGWGIRHITTSPYHAGPNQVKRLNRNLVIALTVFHHQVQSRIALDNLKRAQRRVAASYNKGRIPVPFVIGNTVLCKEFPQSSAIERISAKLCEKWSGPRLIDECLTPVTVRLSDKEDKNVFRRTHESHLKIIPP